LPPNSYGLYDAARNVWQWRSDWYRPDCCAQLAAAAGTRETRKARAGPPIPQSRENRTWWTRPLL